MERDTQQIPLLISNTRQRERSGSCKTHRSQITIDPRSDRASQLSLLLLQLRHLQVAAQHHHPKQRRARKADGRAGGHGGYRQHGADVDQRRGDQRAADHALPRLLSGVVFFPAVGSGDRLGIRG